MKKNLVDVNDLLTIDQTAFELKVCRRTLYNWLDNGIAPPGVSICSKPYFFRSKLAGFQKPQQGKAYVRN